MFCFASSSFDDRLGKCEAISERELEEAKL